MWLHQATQSDDMSNPYQPPQSTSPDAKAQPAGKRTRGDYARLVVSSLIAVFCVLQFWGILYLALSTWDSLVGVTSPMAIMLKLTRPALLFLSGVFLLFQRKLASYGFTAYIVSGLIFLPETGRNGVLLSLLVISGFLAYTLSLHKAGRLR
ncbi:hypothetical protein V1318_10825 [Lysobacter sp. CCNWLW3]|uniref:hypothetical protein n=1 Tax=unclassified Lysobacter TaxID=2635362 RepID=UPI002FD2CA9E